MINLTTKPQLVNQNITIIELDQAIRAAIQYTIKSEAEHFGSTNGSPVLRTSSGRHTFATTFMEELAAPHIYGEKFIQAAYVFSQINNIREVESIPSLSSILIANNNKIVNRYILNTILSGLRTTFLHLWHRGVLMLPLSFRTGSSVRKSCYKDLLTEVAAFFWNYCRIQVKNDQDPSNISGWEASSFAKMAHRIIWATDWHTFEAVNLEELSNLHMVTTTSPPEFPNMKWPFFLMIKTLLEQHSTRLGYTKKEVSLYSVWIHGDYHKEFSFDGFCDSYTSIRLSKRKVNNFKRSIRSREKYEIQKRGLEETYGSDFTKSFLHLSLEELSSKGDHNSALKYFTLAVGLDRNFTTATFYHGRTNIDVAALSNIWIKTFEGWLEFRRAQGYEYESNNRSNLRLLSDYLFCYLPWWLELHPQSNIEFPLSPADFNRFVFLVSNNKDIEDSPVPFLEISKLRRRTPSVRGDVISTLYYYFEYLKGYSSFYPELEGRTITNPIILTLDYPKTRKTASKTNKVPFSKKVFPYLLRYLYAIERFGMHLQQSAMKGKPLQTLHNQPSIFKPCDFKYQLELELGGIFYSINQVPNVFPVSKRTMRAQSGEIIATDIPHLNALRLIIVGLETGLRMQAVQWLDLRTWDSLNTGKSTEMYYYDLYVNTDKTKQKPWVCPLVYRAREVLSREQQFQLSIFEEGMDELIPYEHRKHSRFDDVLPLFRNSGSKGNPVADTLYNKIWLGLQLGFQNFYNEEVSMESFTQFVKTGPSWVKGIEVEGNIKVEFDTAGTRYCPIRFTPIHTPHAARSTFISNRAGILVTEDIAEAVGHLNTDTTHHYMIEDYDQLVNKLQVADMELYSYDPNNPVYIRADKENSALRQSLTKDRQETAKAFGFISVSLLNEKDESIEEGVERLRTTPMNQIVFRETHICPVGEVCPTNVMDLIQEPRRCGLCPLAVKSVDHLPAIAAKMAKLLEQVETATSRLERLQKLGEPQPVLDEINERRKLDVLEFVGWNRAFNTLSNTLQSIRDSNMTAYHVDEPEIVKLHLTHVPKRTNKVEFILDRIIDSEAYPSMETAEIRAKANRLRQQLLANIGHIREAMQEIDMGDEITAFLSSLRAVMKAYNLTKEKILDLGLLENGNKTLSDWQSPSFTDTSALIATCSTDPNFAEEN